MHPFNAPKLNDFTALLENVKKSTEAQVRQIYDQIWIISPGYEPSTPFLMKLRTAGTSPKSFDFIDFLGSAKPVCR